LPSSVEPGPVAASWPTIRVLRQFVQDRLAQRWSPEQICQALRQEFPAEPARHLVPETVYQAIYRPDRGGLRRDLPSLLRTGRRRRKPHRRPNERRPGGLVAMAMIDQRPAEAADRRVPGHWEGDRATRGRTRGVSMSLEVRLMSTT
jgi:IS30 family transposase